MKPFMDKDFLLETETAKHLFHDYSDPMPLVDYHCHISPKEIYEDRRFNNIAEVWLGGENPDGTYFGDHYKWRVMRSNGTPEEYITGHKPDFERFVKFAEALEMAIGNPMYHWSNAELHKYFGITEPLTVDNAKEIWDKTADMLQNDPNMSVRGLIKQSNVAFIGTTDDPIDSLEWHEKIAADPSIEVKVCPSYRPDKAININKEGFAEYGLDYIPFRPATAEEVDAVYKKVMAGEAITVEEAEKYQTAVLLALAKAYHRLGIAMQIHYSCYRNANERIFRKMGPDTGVDMIAQNTCGEDIARLLSALDMTNECPKTIIYSLNPADNEQIGTMLGCFQSDEVPGKIQHGSAWWFNDTKSGMEDQMKSLANLGLLGNFVGMLTDSRSFLSYARHDYFRRIMCNLIGKWVENGEYPNNEASLKKIVEGISYKNAARYFGL